MRGQEFYDLAINTEYPFDDQASLIDQTGRRLPEGLLADMSCMVDRDLARRIFCSAVTKQADFCTVVFSADAVDRPALGFISFRADQEELYATYGTTPQRILTPVRSGFSGTIVLGEQWRTVPSGIWKFDDPASSRIAARCCFPVRVPTYQSVSSDLGAAPLSGLVDLLAQGDIDIKLATRLLAGQARQAIVVSLKPGLETLTSYAGTGLARPESRSCQDPQPIETINGVRADCCERIYIELRGCAQPIPIANHCGVVLDCPLTLTEICPAPPNYSETENPDECLAGGALDPLQSSSNLPDLPPDW